LGYSECNTSSGNSACWSLEPVNEFSNSVTNFPLDGNITGAGRWSYLNISSLSSTTFTIGQYSQQGNGVIYGTNVYAADINNPNYVWCTNSLGQWWSDTRSLSWVYTLNEGYQTAPRGVEISGTIASDNLRLCVLQTNDTIPNSIGSSVTVLYDQTLPSHSFNIIIPPNTCDAGNDIVFLVQNTSGNNWWVAHNANFSVKGLNN